MMPGLTREMIYDCSCICYEQFTWLLKTFLFEIATVCLLASLNNNNNRFLAIVQFNLYK